MRLPIVFFIACALAVAGCHTYAWQPVADQVKGTWTLQPVEPTYIEQWTFNSGKLTIAINGTQVEFEEDNGNTVAHLTYRVDNTILNHYLIIDNLPLTSGYHRIHPTIERFLVITAGDDELYLSSESEEGLKGGFQFHLFKI